MDARQATLQAQALGAFNDHAQVTGTPSADLLDDLAAFQSNLFSSTRVAKLARAVENGTTPLPDADGHLTPLQAQGKAVFTRACGQCHGGPGLSTPIAQTFNTPPGPPPGGTAARTIVRYHSIQAQCPRPVDPQPVKRWNFDPCEPRLARNARTYEITTAPVPPATTPTVTRVTTSDPGRLLLTGVAADVGVFDNTPLRGISKTAPYFHNNSAATLEDVVDHYSELFKRAAALNPGIPVPILTTDGVHLDRPHTPAERPALLAYLRTL
jgi:cytochrome c peroxidase